MTLEQLRSTYRDYPVKFVEGQGPLPYLDVKTTLAEARVYLQGAHVSHFQPAGMKPVLFMSSQSRFEPGKPIRGGVPVCWPWFGPKEGNPSAPAHGFARMQEWELISATALPTNEVQIVLRLGPSQLSRKYGFDAFVLEHWIRIGNSLSMALATRNTGRAPITIQEALHTYFAVGDVHRATVSGLQGATYMDKTKAFARFTEPAAAISFTQETDRHFLGTEATTTIDDLVLSRRIEIRKAGSRSTVVWNPWIDKAKAMSDFGDEEWPQMICVETANAADDAVTVAPGAVHEMQAVIRAARL